MYGRPVTNVHGNYRKDAGHPRKDKRRFSRSAGMTNSLNLRAVPMRGGIRL